MFALRPPAVALQLCAALCLGLGLTLGVASADPLPLSSAHAHLDTASECNRCHIAFTGIPDQKCTGCHRDIDLRLQRGAGYHGRVAGSTPCTTCHREHLGRNHDLVPLDRKTFDHNQTGWPLTGGHVGPTCRDCHTAKRPGTNRDSYLGASTECKACHGDYHGKALGKVDLADCDDCHNTINWRKLNGNLKFDHEKQTRFPRTGEHAKVACEKCHSQMKTFGPIQVSGCITCHQDPHPKGVFARRICEECHVTTGFKKTNLFDHAGTGFPLRHKHRENVCLDCHKWESFKPRTSDCSGCHKDGHRGQLGSSGCAKCHTETSFNYASKFNHQTMSRFPLQGRHKKVDCGRCHTNGRYKPIEPACETCHREQNPHGDTFGTAPCGNCHAPEGWNVTRFDHGVTGFPLAGRHVEQPCFRCHPNGTEVEDDTVQDCVFCHRDIHRNQFEGAACERCHRGFEAWKIPKFDHTLSRFQLQGTHEEVDCNGCHKSGHFRPIDTACGNCHQNFHAPQFSTACTDCHKPAGWRRVDFDHDRGSRFPLDGKHEQVDCAKCHVNNDYKGLPMGCDGCHVDEHKGKHGNLCEKCHTTKDWSTNLAQNHDFGAFRLEGVHDLLPCEGCHGEDRKKELGGTGPECISCHRDPHFSSFGPACNDCHSQQAFLPAKFRHDDTGFRLSGSHRFVECRECHPQRVFGGLPSTCDFCHTDTFQKTTKPDHERCCPGGLTSCENCHTTGTFLRARAGAVCGDPRDPPCAPR